MSRWIEIDTALFKTVSVGGLSAKALWKRIMLQPSIDIVRCKECKYCHYEQENDIYHCYKLFHRFYDANKHFCSYGEREGE